MVALASLASVTITSFLAVVLVRAAWHKAEGFLETVGFAQGYGLVPDAWAAPIVRALTAIEVAIVLALLVPSLRPLGGLAAAALFAGYGLLMATALMQGRSRIECGCGGAPQIVSAFTLARNALLALMGLTLAFLPVATVRPLEAAAAIAAALVLAAILTVTEKLASHLPHIHQQEEN
ncbi:MauE/DoxX family redox-associated membrane protein [Paracoccus marinaquae]|uniref:Methylamine utilization protein MauE n=1 Tax=Paracoccus marinaquae TaxID=2841926 RepID=A0ABS6ADS0_9RHOB|nr:MauE/DoxX family redox-associated membrane protein [Paracoccus marinaquae]MBU3028738.1 hypothetical protein [Paracoccus marinaquae]